MAKKEGDSDQEISREYLMKVSSQLAGEWKMVGRCLGLSDPLIHNITCDFVDNQAEAKLQMLLKWKQVKGTEATLRALQDALAEARSLSFAPGDLTEGKLKILQNGLKAVYKIFYKSIRPIPYIQDKMYCVDEVFVDGGIQLEKGSGKSSPSQFAESGPNKSENIVLKSYRDIFDSNVFSSKIIVVEGEPGYGKSTLALQAVYDWCTAKSSSPLAGFEVFILLQLRLMKGIKSIYKAIKLLALPRNCTLTENDIKEILASCTRVVIVLDGFDEYPDLTSDVDSDVMEIIKGKMFPDQKTVVLTRAGCLPRNIDPDAAYVRLTGFDDEARDQYIRMTVHCTSSDLTDAIKHDLSENPIMSDLCQVPLFFVIFAHMSTDSKDILNCDSVTKFFTYMIRCFYNHMWKKKSDIQPPGRPTFETVDKSALCKLAFEGLTKINQILVWEKEEFVEKVGDDCCKELLNVGILVEEVLLNNSTDSSTLDYFPYRHVIRFYHKTFMEWYAAYHLGELAKNFLFFRNWRLGHILQQIDPQDVQFVFRFACGLNPITLNSIFEYLRGFNDDVATLCIFEAERKFDEIKDSVKKMSMEEIVLRKSQSKLLLRSRIRLLTIAFENQIPISSLKLCDCFECVDLKEERLCLSFGLQLPRLDTLQKLEISYPEERVDLRDQAGDILEYSARCVALKTLRFSSSRTLVPQSFDDKDVLARLSRKNCKVEWEYAFYIGPIWALHVFRWKLSLRSGRWESQEDEEMRDCDYLRVVRHFENNSEDDEDTTGKESENLTDVMASAEDEEKNIRWFRGQIQRIEYFS